MDKYLRTHAYVLTCHLKESIFAVTWAFCMWGLFNYVFVGGWERLGKYIILRRWIMENGSKPMSWDTLMIRIIFFVFCFFEMSEVDHDWPWWIILLYIGAGMDGCVVIRLIPNLILPHNPSAWHLRQASTITSGWQNPYEWKRETERCLSYIYHQYIYIVNIKKKTMNNIRQKYVQALHNLVVIRIIVSPCVYLFLLSPSLDNRFRCVYILVT